MSTSSLALLETHDAAAWNARLAASPQATVFCGTPFLQALGCRYRLMEVRAGLQCVALLPLIEDAVGERVVAHAFTPYQGLLFLHAPGSTPRQQVLDEFRIGEFVAAELATRYRAITLPLSWQVTDLRPFLWHNYHASDQPRYAVTPRYTAVLDVAGLDQASYPAEVRACRRQELRKAAELGISETVAVDQFISLYADTFARQAIDVAEPTLALVRRIAEASLTEGWGRLSACITRQGVASMNLFVYDHRRAYYLFGANDPTQRNSGAATRLIFDNIAEAQRRGLAELDFVGVNSPARGDFKLSFNPALKLYFELNLAHAEQTVTA